VSARFGRLAVVAGVIPALLACLPIRPAGAGQAAGYATLENATVGYTLRYPADWRVTGRVLTTEFSRGVTCQSVQVVDFQPPADSGAAGFIRHAFVQLCAKPGSGGVSLDAWLESRYGAPLGARFEPVEVGGLAGWRLHEPGEPSLTFVRTELHTIEIVAAVATDEAHAALRRAQVGEIVASLVFRRSEAAQEGFTESNTHHERGESWQVATVW